MSHQSIRTALCVLAIPLSLSPGCGDEPADNGGDASQLASARASLIDLKLLGSDEPMLLHPVRVAVAAELSGEAFETDLVIGLRTTDGELRCSLGGTELIHAGDIEGEGEAGSLFETEVELTVDATCAELVGRADVELFAAFDPWDRLGDKRYDDAAIAKSLRDGEIDHATLVESSALPTESCSSCEEFELHESPGLDAQLRALGLSSSVAVVAAPDPNTPDVSPQIAVSSTLRVAGLAGRDELGDGVLEMNYDIRPADGGGDWLPLHAGQGEALGVADPVELGPTSNEVSRVTGVHIQGKALDELVDGAWAEREQFELRACVRTTFDQAVYPGEYLPRDNDCATLPVLIVRDAAGAGASPESLGIDGGGQEQHNMSVGTIREADVSSNNWYANAGVFGQAALNLTTWVDLNGSIAPNQHTYAGILVEETGVWFEAGARAYFDYTDPGNTVHHMTFADMHASLIAYDEGDGKLAMGLSAFGINFIPPFEEELDNGVPMPLEDILEAMNLPIPTTFAFPIYGLSAGVSTGVGSFEASFGIEGEVGIDPVESHIMTSAGVDGPVIEGVVVPFLDVNVGGGLAVDISGFAGASVSAVVTLLGVDFPYTATIEANKSADPLFMQLHVHQSVDTILHALQGNISWSASYPCFPNLWDTCNQGGDLLSWGGFTLGTWNLFNKSTVHNYGMAPNFCTGYYHRLHHGDFDGDGLTDLMCHDTYWGNRWVDKASNGFNGADWTDPIGWCEGVDDDIYLGDFDGDGRTDMLCPRAGWWGIDYADAQGNFDGANWSLYTNWCSHAGGTLHVGDFDGDNLDDVLCEDKDGKIWIDHSDAGTFASTEWYNGGGWCVGPNTSFRVGDYDGDEREDLDCVYGGAHHIDFAANGFGATEYTGASLPLDCGPVGGWYQNPAPTPAFDGQNCYLPGVAPVVGGLFIWANAWHVTPGPNNSCAVGVFDGLNCYIGTAPQGTQAYYYANLPHFTAPPQ